MKKSVVIFLAALCSFNAMAQTVPEGLSNLYAERFQSARSVFEKLTTANPNNLEAVYWLGQTLLAQKDTAGAKALYQRTLTANGNAPYILAGVGQINLMEGKSAEARTQFEQAITASKGKKTNDPAILNAVGRANVQAFTDAKPYGDLDYAIAKLNEAGQIAPTNTDIFINLGNAYRKKRNGGEAVQAYRKAGNYAPALYRISKVYGTQNNWEVVLENLNSTIAADAKFAPAYEDLYYYNLNTKRDFNAAESFAKLYIANSDPSVENDYLQAQTVFVQKRYQEAVNIASKILQQTNNNPKSRVYRLLAYSYLELKDTAKACDFSNQFLAKATEDELIGQDYFLHAATCGNRNPDIVGADIEKAVNMDSVPSRQLKLLNDAIATARSNQQYLLESRLMLKQQQILGAQAKPATLFYIGTILYYGQDYVKSDSVLSAYITAFPDSLNGYYWRGLTRIKIDTSMSVGAFVPDFEKTIQLAAADTSRFKSQSSQATQTLVVYYYNVKKDKAAAQAVLEKGLLNDANNPSLLDIQKKLAGTPKQTTPVKTPVKPDTKPKTTTGAKPKK